MGFEMWMDCYGETARAGLSRDSVRRLFPMSGEESQSESWIIQYDSRNSCRIEVRALEADSEKLNHLFIERPCGDMRLWEALFSILRMGSVVIFWPSSPPIVADGADFGGLPEGMVEALGDPVTVGDGGELLRNIHLT
jgi:hypothetical protein